MSQDSSNWVHESHADAYSSAGTDQTTGVETLAPQAYVDAHSSDGTDQRTGVGTLKPSNECQSKSYYSKPFTDHEQHDKNWDTSELMYFGEHWPRPYSDSMYYSRSKEDTETNSVNIPDSLSTATNANIPIASHLQTAKRFEGVGQYSSPASGSSQNAGDHNEPSPEHHQSIEVNRSSPGRQQTIKDGYMSFPKHNEIVGQCNKTRLDIPQYFEQGKSSTPCLQGMEQRKAYVQQCGQQWRRPVPNLQPNAGYCNAHLSSHEHVTSPYNSPHSVDTVKSSSENYQHIIRHMSGDRVKYEEIVQHSKGSPLYYQDEKGLHLSCTTTEGPLMNQQPSSHATGLGSYSNNGCKGREETDSCPPSLQNMFTITKSEPDTPLVWNTSRVEEKWSSYIQSSDDHCSGNRLNQERRRKTWQLPIIVDISTIDEMPVDQDEATGTTSDFCHGQIKQEDGELENVMATEAVKSELEEPLAMPKEEPEVIDLCDDSDNEIQITEHIPELSEEKYHIPTESLPVPSTESKKGYIVDENFTQLSSNFSQSGELNAMNNSILQESSQSVEHSISSICEEDQLSVSGEDTTNKCSEGQRMLGRNISTQSAQSATSKNKNFKGTNALRMTCKISKVKDQGQNSVLLKEKRTRITSKKRKTLGKSTLGVHPNEEEDLACPICNKNCKPGYHLIVHLKREHPTFCQFCFREYKPHSSLQNHLILYHNQEVTKAKENELLENEVPSRPWRKDEEVEAAGHSELLDPNKASGSNDDFDTNYSANNGNNVEQLSLQDKETIYDPTSNLTPSLPVDGGLKNKRKCTVNTENMVSDLEVYQKKKSEVCRSVQKIQTQGTKNTNVDEKLQNNTTKKGLGSKKHSRYPSISATVGKATKGLKDQESPESKQLCTICLRVYKNRASLIAHTYRSHSKETARTIASLVDITRYQQYVEAKDVLKSKDMVYRKGPQLSNVSKNKRFTKVNSYIPGTKADHAKKSALWLKRKLNKPHTVATLESEGSYCQPHFKANSELAKNEILHHRKDLQAAGRKPNQNASGDKEANFHRNVEMNHSSKSLSCSLCSKICNSSKELDRHIQNHSGLSRKEYNRMLFPCPICSQTYNSYVLLSKHLHTNHYWKEQSKNIDETISEENVTQNNSEVTACKKSKNVQTDVNLTLLKKDINNLGVTACKKSKNVQRKGNLTLLKKDINDLEVTACMKRKNVQSEGNLTMLKKEKNNLEVTACKKRKNVQPEENLTLLKKDINDLEVTACKKSKNVQSEGNLTLLKKDINDFICDLCQKQCASHHGLMIHKGKRHKENSNVLPTEVSLNTNQKPDDSSSSEDTSGESSSSTTVYDSSPSGTPAHDSSFPSTVASASMKETEVMSVESPVDKIEKGYMCPFCCRWHTSLNTIESHLKNFHRCDSSVITKELQAMNVLFNSGEKQSLTCKPAFSTRLLCHKCSETFENYQDFQVHYSKSHKKIQIPGKEAKFKNCPLKSKSKQCMIVRHLDDSKEQRIVEHNMNERSQCNICGRFFKNILSLSTHIRFYHKENEQYKVSCTLCSKKFKNKFWLCLHKEHVHGKTSISSFCCDPCTKAFKTSRELAAHDYLYHRKELKLHFKAIDNTGGSGRKKKVYTIISSEGNHADNEGCGDVNAAGDSKEGLPYY